MILILVGLGLGVLSGAVTYAITVSLALAFLAGVIATVLTWCGAATLLFFED